MLTIVQAFIPQYKTYYKVFQQALADTYHYLRRLFYQVPSNQTIMKNVNSFNNLSHFHLFSLRGARHMVSPSFM